MKTSTPSRRSAPAAATPRGRDPGEPPSPGVPLVVLRSADVVVRPHRDGWLHVPAMEHERRLAFGAVAELYDRARPSYPEALVEDVVALAPLGSPPRALEVGAGTGKATVLFAARGVAVHALAPSAEMAA